MKVIVLCLNDFPIGVYNSERAANTAQEIDRGERIKTYLAGEIRRALYYHQHEFEVNRINSR